MAFFIGLALATDLAQKGWKLAIVDMNTTQGEAVMAKLGEGNAIFIKADVSKWPPSHRLFRFCIRIFLQMSIFRIFFQRVHTMISAFLHSRLTPP